MERPSFQFYPEAWLADVALRACSSSARGLWIDMLCLMHQGTPYGHLVLRGTNGDYFLPDVHALAKMTGNAPEEVEAWMRELDQVGVIGRTRSGAIFSKKMVRDEHVRKHGRLRQARWRSKTKTKSNRDLEERYITGGVTPLSRGSPTPSSSSEDLKFKKPKDPERSSQTEGSSIFVPVKPGRDEIPDGVSWSGSEEGIRIEETWLDYLRGYLRDYGLALDNVAPSSAGVALTKQDYQNIVERINGSLLTNPRLRAGPKSKPGKWRAFRAYVRNEFVRALLRKREYHQRKSSGKGEPKSFQALKKSWEKLKDGE